MTQQENQLSDEELFAQMLGEEPQEGQQEQEAQEVEAEDQPEPQERPENPEQGDEPDDSGEQEPGPERQPESDSEAEDSEPEWYASLSEEARAHFEELQGKTQRLHQSYQAVHGRVAPMQRQVSDLRKQLEQVENPTTPTLEDLEKSDEWKAISEDLPQEAGQVKKLFSSQARVIQKKDEESRHQQEQFLQYQQRIKAREEQRLEGVFQNHRQVTSHPAFSQWCGVVQQNPTQFPDIAEALQSPFYEDAEFVLSRFRHDLQQFRPEDAQMLFGQQEPQPADKKAEKPSVSRRAPPNPSPPSQSAGVSGNSGGRPMTEEEYFASLIPD